MWRLLAVVLGGSLATGCVDFVFPNIPGIEDRGGPVRFNGHVVVTDSGRVSANATLRPGLDIDGYKRPVTMPFLRVMDDVLEPDSVLRDGTRRYRASWERGPDVMAGPLTLVAPRVEGVQGAPPGVEWFGLRRAGPSSIRLSEGEDLLLPIIEVEGTTGHPPPVRQWFLTLSSGDRSYRVSSNGMPPIPVSVPPRWIPEGDTVRVRLIFSQSAVLREPPGDYVGAVTIDSWFLWTVVVEPPVTARVSGPSEHREQVSRIVRSRTSATSPGWSTSRRAGERYGWPGRQARVMSMDVPAAAGTGAPARLSGANARSDHRPMTHGRAGSSHAMPPSAATDMVSARTPDAEPGRGGTRLRNPMRARRPGG